MIPEEMNMYQHPNAGEKQRGKEVADGLNLKKMSPNKSKNSWSPHMYMS